MLKNNIISVIIVASPKCPPKPERHWWQKKICYQIWTKSYKDSNEDGVGDLNGIREKLPLMSTTLRMSAIWLVPLLRSKNGNGYDVLDFKAIDPAIGTLEDFEKLVEAVHGHGM